MRNLFIDIQLGASGDMLLGALIDLGLDINKLVIELDKLKISGWEILPKRLNKYHINGISANVKAYDNKSSRKLKDIIQIIEKSLLSDKVKSDIRNVFVKLSEAEAIVHGISIDDVHLHEISAIDSIVDICSFCIALEMLMIDNIYFNKFNFGSGLIESSHGILPIPSPALVELSKGYNSFITQYDGEVTTPTAAALLTTLGKQISNDLSFKLISKGIGFGTKNYQFPSYTRIFLTESDNFQKIVQIECNIDDMNPQIYPHLIELLFMNGALDVYLNQIIMKKGRPGILLTVITEDSLLESLKEIIYTETTTLGLREIYINREKINRRFETVTIHNKHINIKLGYLNNQIINIQPEYEDCNKLAKDLKLPLKTIFNEAVEAYKKKI